MSYLSFQDIVRLGGHKGIVLCRSATVSGEPFFHYIKADRQHIEQMHRDYAEKKTVNFTTYGEIVYSGWGENPSEKEERMIHERFSK